jgi:hypothetical protein
MNASKTAAAVTDIKNADLNLAIRTNQKGSSRLLLSYPIGLRLRAAAMSKVTGVSQQEIIRTAISDYLTKWEYEQDQQAAEKPARKTRKPRIAKTA